MQDLAAPVPFTDSTPATEALVAELRAVVLSRMTPAGLEPDPITLYALDEHLADALVWCDVALVRQAELDADPVGAR